MTTTAQLRHRYARDAVTTASPARLLTMLYDRLAKDLATAEQAVAARDVQGAHNALVHAQAIVTELAASLDTSIWRDGEGLLRLYQYVLDELVSANVTKDAQHIANAREVVEPIRDAWRQVSLTAAAAS